MSLNSKQSIFYQGFSISTVIYNDKSTSIIRSGASPIAERTLNSTLNEPALLSIDTSNTPVSIARNENILGKVFSAYGYSSEEHREHSLIGFAGETSIAAGKYLLGSYRIFDPVLMRFHSPDNLSPFLAGSINCYGYCSGDPINNTDPTGHVKSPLKLFRKLLSNKKSKPMNTGLSQSTPAINQSSEYSQPSSFNPAFENTGKDIVPSRSDLKAAKSLPSINGVPKAPTLEQMAKYEPSAPMPVNTITGDNLKYLKSLEDSATRNYALMRQRHRGIVNTKEHRRAQQLAGKFGDLDSNEITKMLFEPGYTPSPSALQKMLRN